MLSVVVLSVIMLGVIMLNTIMLSVVAPIYSQPQPELKTRPRFCPVNGTESAINRALDGSTYPG
jgi:hypothetical protein